MVSRRAEELLKEIEMKRKLGKKLTLNRETVRELTGSQLRWVAGGDQTNGNNCGGGGPITAIGQGGQGGCSPTVVGPSNSQATCVCYLTCGVGC